MVCWGSCWKFVQHGSKKTKVQERGIAGNTCVTAPTFQHRNRGLANIQFILGFDHHLAMDPLQLSILPWITSWIHATFPSFPSDIHTMQRNSACKSTSLSWTFGFWIQKPLIPTLRVKLQCCQKVMISFFLVRSLFWRRNSRPINRLSPTNSPTRRTWRRRCSWILRTPRSVSCCSSCATSCARSEQRRGRRSAKRRAFGRSSRGRRSTTRRSPSRSWGKWRGRSWGMGWDGWEGYLMFLIFCIYS